MEKEVKHVDVIVIFTDIRSFTKWNKNTELFQYSPNFIDQFYNSLKDSFQGWYSKGLRDGSLFIKELKENEYKKLIGTVISHVMRINKSFDVLCKNSEEQQGVATRLKIGWSIACSSANKIINNNDGTEEYIGSVINKTSRLCDKVMILKY